MSDQCVTDIRRQRAMAAVSDEQTLRSRLDETVKRRGLQNVCVGVLLGERDPLIASAASTPAAVVGVTSANDPAVTVGCLAKSLTATLMSEAVAAGHVSWGDFAADVLACGAHGRQQLAGVTLRHLLDHSHGLDGSAIAAVPHRADGFIDVEALCRDLDARPLSLPGQMYSYGHVGAWLAGASLESICGSPYASQLHEQQLVLEKPCRELTTVCPATGADLTLTVSEWLSFACRCMDQWQHPSSASPERVKLPGWHPTERSIWRGWKDYGEGWLGHNANLADRSAILRINARQRMAIVLSAHEASGAIFAAAGLFGELLPEFRNLRPPRLLQPDEVDSSRLHQYVGRYVQARATIDITLGANGALSLSVIERTSDQEPPPRCCLRPAEGGVFLAESRANAEFLFVQFIAPETSFEPTHLWNGRQIWRKAAAGS